MSRNKIFCILISFSMLLSSICVSYAVEDVSGAFSSDIDSLYDSYSKSLGWDADRLTSLTWIQDRKEYKRQREYQYEFYRDHIKTTTSYLKGYIAGDGNGENMVLTALAEIGVCENPGGSDCVKYNDWYHGKSGFNPKKSGYSLFGWCAVFVCWCAEQCGLLGEDNIFQKTAWPPSIYGDLVSEGFKAYGTMSTTPMGGSSYTPVPGDIMFFWSTSESRYGHVAIVCEVGDDYITTVGGNEGTVGVVKTSKYSRSFVTSSKGSAPRLGSIVHVEYPEVAENIAEEEE